MVRAPLRAATVEVRCRRLVGAGGSPAEAAAEPAVEPADATMWALKRSNLRSGPGTDHAKVGLLDVGDAVQVTGEIGAWLRIAAPGGGEAFVYGPLLTEEAPERATQAIEEKPREPSKAVSRAKMVEAPTIPDQATRERVADWLDQCRDMWGEVGPHGGYDVDFSSDREVREFLSYYEERDSAIAANIKRYIRTCVRVGKAVNESGRPCRKLAGDVHRSVGLTSGVTRHAKQLFDRGSRLDDSQRRIVEEYLQTCIPAYAAVLEGRPLEPYRPGDQTADLAESPDAGPLHGAIAFSQEADGGYAWGIAWSFDSPAGAVAEATDQCREYGGTGCEEAGWFENACGALAIGDGNGYGTGWGDTLAEAERDALRECRAANADCRVEVARCSQSQEAGGRGRKKKEEDTVAARAPEKAKPAAVVLEPKCGDGVYEHCWREFSNKPGCHAFVARQGDHVIGVGVIIANANYVSSGWSFSTVTWSGSCSDGTANGEGTVSGMRESSEVKMVFEHTGTFAHGILNGRWVERVKTDDRNPTYRSTSEARYEGNYVDGFRHGNWTLNETHSILAPQCIKYRFSNGERISNEKC